MNDIMVRGINMAICFGMILSSEATRKLIAGSLALRNNSPHTAIKQILIAKQLPSIIRVSTVSGRIIFGIPSVKYSNI